MWMLFDECDEGQTYVNCNTYVVLNTVLLQLPPGLDRWMDGWIWILNLEISPYLLMLVVSLFVQFAALSAGQISNTLWNQFHLNKSTYCTSAITQLWIPNRTPRRQSGYSAVFICFMMIYCCGYFVDYHCIIHTLDRCPCPGSTSAYLFISNGCIGGV